MNYARCISLTVLLALPLFLQSCASRAGVTCDGETEKAQRISERIENELPLRHNDTVTNYVRAFGLHLAEQAGIAGKANWRFAVVRDRSVNAFSIGDGRIYVTEGAILAAHNQDEFAGVLAHEMGHQLAGHFCLQTEVGYRPGPAPAQLGSLRQGMDPDKEREADRYSVGILVDAGYDPAARSRVISRSRISPNGTNQPRASDGTRQGTALQKNQSALARAQAALLGDY